MSEFIEIAASKASVSKRKKVCGVGINDASYIVYPRVNGSKVKCPYYRTWASMILRCYDLKCQARQTSYAECSVCDEWLTFSIFKEWMITQDWEGKQLDKDLLLIGNKTYSPEKCIFVSAKINSMFLNSSSIRGGHPQGVSYCKRSNKYRAQGAVNGKKRSLGYFKTEKEAERSYLMFKVKVADSVSCEVEVASNPVLRKAILRHTRSILSKRICD